MNISEGSVAAALSSIAIAGAGETGLLDSLPKGGLVLLTTTLLGIVFFFVRRDANRVAKRFEAMELAITKRCDCSKRRRRGKRRVRK